MKKIFRRTLIIGVAAVCAVSLQLTASALSDVQTPNLDIIKDWIDDFIYGTTTTQAPDDTTQPSTENPDNTTTDPNATTDPVNSSGSGSVTTTEPTVDYPQYNYTPDNSGGNTYYPQNNNTTEPAGDEEDTSFTYEGSLSDWLEADSAAIIVQTPSENFTIGGLIVNNGDDGDDSMSWQQIALIAAAVLFVVLAALIVALLIQKSRKSAENDGISVNTSDNDVPAGPVPVEVMSAERIAELLGSARNGRVNIPADDAAALKTAILMGQLTQTYSDPLIRKYTDEPVRMSPLAGINENGDVSAAQILEATDSMLDDITGNEKYASDISGMDFPETDLESLLDETETKSCPECGSPVQSVDVFCHSCGAYVG